MERKAKIEAFVASAGKTAKNLLDSAVQAVDQNNDGKFDLTDVSSIAESMGSSVKKSALIVKESAEEKAKQWELKSLQPIFPTSLDRDDFFMSKLIRVVDRDKKRAGSEVCQGSIGYESEQKSLHIVNIFRNSIEAFGLTFYPNCDCEFYYVDPSESQQYIALDEYFSYLKIARVNELKKIAQDLGAKHFRVIYKEEESSVSEKKAKAHIKAPPMRAADIDHKFHQKKDAAVDVAAEMTFPGHAPVRPQLKYLQTDPNIQTLIAMRMNESTPLLHEKFTLKMSNSSGLKESEALKIDAALKGLKCSGNMNILNEAKKESRRYLEYDIEF